MSESSDSTPLESSERVLIATLFAVALALRLALIESQSQTIDEVTAVLSVRLDFLSMLRERFTNGHLPLYFSGMWVWTRLFGDGLLAIRIPSALTSAAAIPVAYFVARRIAGRTAALVAAAFLALHPFQLYLAQVGRMYSLVALLGLTALLGLISGREGPTRRHVILFGSSMLAGLYTSGSFLLVSTGILVYLLTLGRDAAPWWRTLAVVGAVYSPLPVCVLTLHRPGGILSWIPPLTTADVLAIPTRIAFDLMATRSFTSYETMVSFAMIFAAFLGIRALDKHGRSLVFVVAVPLVAAIGVSIVGPNLLRPIRYFATPNTLTTVLAAIGLTVLHRRFPRTAIGAIVVSVLVFGIGSSALSHGQIHYDFPEVARILELNRAEGEDVLLFAAYRGQRRALKYFYEGHVHAVDDGEDSFQDSAGVWMCVPNRTRALLWGPSPQDPERAELIRTLRMRFPVERSFQVYGGLLTHLTRADDRTDQPDR